MMTTVGDAVIGGEAALPANETPKGPTIEAVLRTLAHAIETEGSIRTVFGEPIPLETHKVVPVATLELGLGAGGGKGQGVTLERVRDAAAQIAARLIPNGFGFGLGGGLSIKLQPAGFIHEQDGKVVFTPIGPNRR